MCTNALVRVVATAGSVYATNGGVYACTHRKPLRDGEKGKALFLVFYLIFRLFRFQHSSRGISSRGVRMSRNFRLIDSGATVVRNSVGAYAPFDLGKNSEEKTISGEAHK